MLAPIDLAVCVPPIVFVERVRGACANICDGRGRHVSTYQRSVRTRGIEIDEHDRTLRRSRSGTEYAICFSKNAILLRLTLLVRARFRFFSNHRPTHILFARMQHVRLYRTQRRRGTRGSLYCDFVRTPKPRFPMSERDEPPTRERGREMGTATIRHISPSRTGRD